MLKRFLSYYRPHLRLFIPDMLASLLVALIGVVYPMVTRTMLNELIPDRNYRMIVLSGAALLLLYMVRMLLNYFIQYQGHMMGVYMRRKCDGICSAIWNSFLSLSMTTTKRERLCPA